jgi:hypothetical protein
VIDLISQKAFLKSAGLLGIEMEPSAPYNTEQNGVAERGFRSLFESVRAIMDGSRLPHYTWDVTLETATCTYKRQSRGHVPI